MEFTKLKQTVENFALFFSVVFPFFILISTAAMYILLGFTLLFWLVSANFSQKWEAIKSNPVAMAALFFFAISLLGLTYGEIDASSLSDTFRILLIPIFISLLRTERARVYGLRSFLASLVITLLLSYLYWFDLLPEWEVWSASPAEATPFTRYITHSIFMALGAFIFATMAIAAETRRTIMLRIIFSLIAGLMAFNILFMVQGKTGQLAFLLLFLFFLGSLLRTKFIPLWLRISLVTVTTIMLLGIIVSPQSAIHKRSIAGFNEVTAFKENGAVGGSVTPRMVFTINSIEIIKKNPFLGVGTGGFSQAYSEQVQGTDFALTSNPHNEYIFIATQLGVVGLFVFLLLLGTQWRKSFSLDNPEMGTIARGLILTFVLASMLSSTLMDSAEGTLFYWMSGLLFAGLSKNTTLHLSSVNKILPNRLRLWR
ncbi:MAG: O-antigen ligase family protein [Deltaproteobacteria bacterium]|nr:O-antigen ligase family protein [Deltaproteobacteria bacterium]